ncbi:omptin family outer membrane protease [Brucellaceae bacterium D45D]
MRKLILFIILISCPNYALAKNSLEGFTYKKAENDLFFIGGIGYTWLKSDEIVYVGGNRISHLFWQSQMPVLTAAFKANPYDKITLMGRVKIGLSGSHKMDDYDWVEPYFKSYDFDDWTDLSISDEVNLERYINLDIALGRDFELNKNNIVNLHGGFKYTNIKWTAMGGEFIYSENGFRDYTGRFPERKGITYEQRFPGVFLGAEWTLKMERLSFSLLGRVGATFSAKDIDNHWLRDLRFTEKFEARPFIDTQLEVAYAFTPRTNVYLSAGYEEYFRMKGDAFIDDRSTGQTSFSANSAGTGLRSFTLGAGLKVAF